MPYSCDEAAMKPAAGCWKLDGAKPATGAANGAAPRLASATAEAAVGV